MTLGPIVLLLQATAAVPADRGIYPELDARAEVEAAGWRIRGGRVLRRGVGGGDADGDGIPDAVDILLGAKKVALDGAIYRETAPRLPYPGGDVPRQDGVCTDVVIRALRNAGIDLQRAVHDDAGRGPLGLSPHRPAAQPQHRSPAGEEPDPLLRPPLAPAAGRGPAAAGGRAVPERAAVGARPGPRGHRQRSAQPPGAALGDPQLVAGGRHGPAARGAAGRGVPGAAAPAARYNPPVPTLLALFGSKAGLRLPLEGTGWWGGRPARACS